MLYHKFNQQLIKPINFTNRYLIDMKKEPTCKEDNTELIIHNHTRNDAYFWMNKRDSEDVLNYISKENKYTKKYFKKLESLKNTLLDEFDARIDPNEKYAPFKLNGLLYQERSIDGKDYNLIYRLDGDQETLFFDENVRAKGNSYYALEDWSPSLDNSLLAISEDFTGRRKYEIRFLDLVTQVYLKDKIKDTDGSIVWANDNKTIFYVKKDPETLREFQVYKHVLGTNSKSDELVFEEKNELYSVYISKSITNKYIEIHCQSSTTSETHLIDSNLPDEKPVVFLPRKKDHIYSIEHHETGFYILSNQKAKNNKIVFSATIPSSIDKCEVIVPHDTKVLIENFLQLQKYILTEERENGLQKIRVIDIKTKKSHFISFDEETYYLGLALNDDYLETKVYFTYNSLTTPSTVYEYDLKGKKREVYFRKELLDKKFNPENYQSERIWATANDGTKIPISLVYQKGLKLNSAPILLYGYGSYGITIPDVFNPIRMSLIDRGFVYAIAHIRGEKYLGEKWYEDGKFLKKRNTFTDFINAAEFLGTKGYCDPEKVYIKGGSAGGLLMGAVTNMAPYLWKGVVAQVPFVDVVTTMLDETIPLTVGEYEEWGNPNEEEYYWYMLSYSPYDNVKKMNYPSMYITTGYHDSQVQYWEPLKWVAKIRKMRTNALPLLFDCNMDAGHGGGSGRSTERIEFAKEYSFILDLEGIKK